MTRTTPAGYRPGEQGPQVFVRTHRMVVSVAARLRSPFNSLGI